MPLSTPRLTFQRLYDTHPLRVDATAGSVSTLIVSMTSVGTERHAWPPREFVKIASQSGRFHVMSVTDISRSWMNGPGVLENTVETIERYILDHGITELVGVGASMGAYNLLVLARAMTFARLVSMGPQFSVHPEIMPDEKRWHFFRKQITDWPYPDASVLPKAPCQIVMMHGDSEDEQMHWRRMPVAANLQHFIFPKTDHNFPRDLRDSGDLVRILRPALQGRISRMRGALDSVGAVSRADYEEQFGG